MYKSQNLLRILLWEMQCSHKKTYSEKQHFYELEAGILKFCVGLELFQHAFGSEELDVLRKELFKHVQNMPGKINFIFQIEILESKIGKAITCLENIKIHSQNLELLCLYLKSLRDGDFTLPEAYKPKQLLEECLWENKKQ